MKKKYIEAIKKVIESCVSSCTEKEQIIQIFKS